MGGWMLAAALALGSPGPPAAEVAPVAAEPAPAAPAVQAPAAAAPPPAVEEVVALPPALSQLVADQVVAPPGSDLQRLQRLLDLMSSADGLGIQYRDDATLTVGQAYQAREANCLTFTLVFIALAREAGLDAYGQEIDETLAWRQQGSTIYRTNHVNAGIRIGGRRYTVDVASDRVIARHPPERVSDQRLLSHFYNNRAADLITQHAVDEAARHMHIALQLDPGYANSWSNQGVVHLRQGKLAQARLAYRRALELEPTHAPALSNMLTLAQRTGDPGGEAEYRSRLERVQARDPFHQFLLASDHERHGRYTLAATHYQRAIRLQGSEHRFHLGLARAYLQLGEPRRANRALRRAQALGGELPAQGSETAWLVVP